MNSEKINELIKLSNILEDYMENDSFLNKERKQVHNLKVVTEKLANRKFTVSIIAAMKAGKSTTFNALIGRDLLPNERAACTASITEIKHSNIPSNYIIKKYVDGTESKIVANNGKDLEECFHEDVRNARKSAQVKGIEKYYLETPIKALQGSNYEELIQNFVLVDTPGPNEADIGDFDVSILQSLALEQLRNSDAMIMLLDYESYKSETNAKILKDIFENREDLADEQNKVFFVLNKIDSMGAKDGTLKDVLDSVKRLIREYAPVLNNPKVYGISGKQAMLARATLDGTASEEMKRQMELDYGSRFSVTIKQGEQELNVIPKANYFAEDLLKLSNIEVIEKDIIAEIFANASIDMINNATNKIDNVTNHILSIVQSKIQALSKSNEELMTIVDTSKTKISEIRGKTVNIEKTVNSELKSLNLDIECKLGELDNKINCILENQIPKDHFIQNQDEDIIRQQMENIRINCLNAVKAALIGEIDKIQRQCNALQLQLNVKVNDEFNILVMEAIKSANEKINFTPKVFDINDIINIEAETEVQKEDINDDSFVEKEFTKVGATVGIGSGVALGAVIGTVVPVLGTAIGAVVGGLIGLFAGSTKNKVRENIKTMYKADLYELKESIRNSTCESIKMCKERIIGDINEFSNSYNSLLKLQISRFLDVLDSDLEKILSDYNFQKQNKDAEIAHMKEINSDMEQVLGVLQNLKL